MTGRSLIQTIDLTKMKRLFVLIFTVVLLSGCETKPEERGFDNYEGWKLLYRNDNEGKTIFGNKQDLIDAARMGYPIRIGFGSKRSNDTTKSVEHIANAAFLTVTNSNELFAQIQPIIGQKPDLDGDSLGINFRENIKWAILVGTNGFSDRLSIDRFKDTIAGHRNLPTEVSWFVDFPRKNDDYSQKVWPLWKK